MTPEERYHETLVALGGAGEGYEELRKQYPYLPPARYVTRAEVNGRKGPVPTLVLELILAPRAIPEPGPDEFGLKE